MSELEKWADALPDRRVLDDFLEWLTGQRMEVCQWTDEAKWPMPLAEDRGQMLNRYFGIDYKALERELRALLAGAVPVVTEDPVKRGESTPGGESNG